MKAERFEVIIVIYSIVAYTVYIYTHCSYYSNTLYISYQITYTSLYCIIVNVEILFLYALLLQFWCFHLVVYISLSQIGQNYHDTICVKSPTYHMNTQANYEILAALTYISLDV
jgi:hypothetical protein